jgi:hypothetical protein
MPIASFELEVSCHDRDVFLMISSANL